MKRGETQVPYLQARSIEKHGSYTFKREALKNIVPRPSRAKRRETQLPHLQARNIENSYASKREAQRKQNHAFKREAQRNGPEDTQDRMPA